MHVAPYQNNKICLSAGVYDVSGPYQKETVILIE